MTQKYPMVPTLFGVLGEVILKTTTLKNYSDEISIFDIAIKLVAYVVNQNYYGDKITSSVQISVVHLEITPTVIHLIKGPVIQTNYFFHLMRVSTRCPVVKTSIAPESIRD